MVDLFSPHSSILVNIYSDRDKSVKTYPGHCMYTHVHTWSILSYIPERKSGFISQSLNPSVLRFVGQISFKLIQGIVVLRGK